MVKDVVDEYVESLDTGPLPVAESVPGVIVPEDEQVPLGGEQRGQLAVPLQVLAVPVAQEEQALIKASILCVLIIKDLCT